MQHGKEEKESGIMEEDMLSEEYLGDYDEEDMERGIKIAASNYAERYVDWIIEKGDDQKASEDFKDLMDWEFNRLGRKSKIATTVKRIACVMAIVVSVASLVAISAGDVGAGCMDFIRSLFNGGVTHYESTDSIDTVDESEDNIIGFDMTYIPEGFEMDDNDSSEVNSENDGVYYCKSKDCRIAFHYTKLYKTDYFLDNEFSKLDVYFLNNGIKADYYVSNENDAESMLIWKYGEYMCHIFIQGYNNGCKPDDYIGIANGVVPIFR